MAQKTTDAENASDQMPENAGKTSKQSLSTREHRVRRASFTREHADLCSVVDSESSVRTRRRSGNAAQLISLARFELGYSDNYTDGDLLCSILKTYRSQMRNNTTDVFDKREALHRAETLTGFTMNRFKQVAEYIPNHAPKRGPTSHARERSMISGRTASNGIEPLLKMRANAFAGCRRI